ncbi:hypothetical protein HYH03_008951 [Edaphochlamys debaryana]|uniref:Uncharacterized protein n=1 Tax=Edaphochlamys debaryana TaxID=47281 RepID=A0A836BXI8_9CHLO|nr:hypothetical protein HYH03_008951 [Edaphochlamys debaryana]|eukprot:KAG2492791.1 hypothetical protein HYH03_008951 [Edaphochlamys debaryana]
MGAAAPPPVPAATATTTATAAPAPAPLVAAPQAADSAMPPLRPAAALAVRGNAAVDAARATRHPGRQVH